MPESPFEIITTSNSKKAGSRGLIIALVVVLFLIAGVVTGVILVRQNQDISEEAYGTQTPIPTRSPSPTPTKSPSPTQTPTKSPQSSPTATAGTATPTPSPTATTTVAQAQTTPLPIPETGASLPTILGSIIGILVIIGSITLAF